MWASVILPVEPCDSFSIYEQIADNIHTACFRLFDMSSSSSNYELIPTAAIIVIGDEILSGRTKDKNIGWLADQLSAMGVQLAEARVIADKKSIIINTVKTLSNAYDLVFTSGGIGPTHDDITTDAVAAACNVPVIRHPEAERRLIAHYENTDLEFNKARQKMADIPDTATLIDNPLSAAPGYIIGNVHVLPGVPTILQAMFEGVRGKLPGGVVMTRITVQCSTGEGNIATILVDVETQYHGVSIGSYPYMKPGHFGTAVVVSAIDVELATEAAKMVEREVRAFGVNAEIVNADGTLAR